MGPQGVEYLKPGRYLMTASKEGFGSPSAATVEMAPGQSLRVDIALASLDDSKGTSDPPPRDGAKAQGIRPPADLG